jgi:two-component system response regulator QseB
MNILYIDDDATNRTVMRGMLATAGVVMDEAADARTGLEMIESSDYALVLMDLRMPGVSGLTAIRQLRTTGADRQIPIVAIIADLTTGVRALCKGAGADEFLSKPVGMEDLFTAIGAALAASKSHRLS